MNAVSIQNYFSLQFIVSKFILVLLSHFIDIMSTILTNRTYISLVLQFYIVENLRLLLMHLGMYLNNFTWQQQITLVILVTMLIMKCFKVLYVTFSVRVRQNGLMQLIANVSEIHIKMYIRLYLISLSLFLSLYITVM